MGTISQDTLQRILDGQTMTARQRPTLDGHSAWVGVVSLERRDDDPAASDDPLGWVHVRTFEVDNHILERNHAAIHESVVDIGRFEVNGTRELEALLERLGVDPAALEHKTGTGYPL